MSAGPGVNLDQGPPLPPNLQPAPQATAQGLAGPQQAQQSGSASLQAQVVQKAMFVDQGMTEIAQMLPSAAALSGLIDQFRKIVATALAQGATPPTGQPGGGLMSSPFGGAGAQPTS